ncbi:MAG: cupin domain-containing protein, partial [Methanoregulaceae archaeon]
GCPRYALRLMEWTPGGRTSYHRHQEEHEMFVLEGEAVAVGNDNQEVHLQPGDALYIAPCEYHQIKNTGSGTLRMICTVPIFPGREGKTTTPCD